MSQWWSLPAPRCHRGGPRLSHGVTKGGVPACPTINEAAGAPREQAAGAGHRRLASSRQTAASASATPAVLGVPSLPTHEVPGDPHGGPLLVTRSAAAAPQPLPWGTPTSQARLSCSRS